MSLRKANGFYGRVLKRVLDFILSLIAVILLSPILLVTALIVRIKLGTPVIYKQDRPGKDGKIFKLYKFRSMSNAKDEKGNLLPDTERLTKFGRTLRAASLDELPELVNILKGDMSIVGPRPLAVEYLPYYTNREWHRHDVRPGLTGLAQISGRNTIDWSEKFTLDLKYIQNLSFLNDVRIVFLTVKKVFKREGIGQAEQAPISLHVERADWLDDDKNMKSEYQDSSM